MAKGWTKKRKKEDDGRIGRMSARIGLMVVILIGEGRKLPPGTEGFIGGVQSRIDEITISWSAGDVLVKLYKKRLHQDDDQDGDTSPDKIFSFVLLDFKKQQYDKEDVDEDGYQNGCQVG